MPISQDMFMAILAMDSYNRGYEAGIGDGQNVVNGVDEDGLGAEGSQIGNAVVIQQDISEAAEAAGFYAVAYQWNGETVISYRGTDNLIDWTNLNPWSDTPGGDIWNSYLTGLGFTANNQAHLVADFYQAVTGTTDSDPRLSDVTLTGHSLGGGLAGFDRQC